MYNRVKGFLAGVIVILFVSSCTSEHEVAAPNKRLKVLFKIENGEPFYRVIRDGQIVVDDSPLGFELLDQPAIKDNLKIVQTDTFSKNETWSQPWGEVKNIHDHHNGLKLTLQEQSGLERIIEITIKVFNDGLGFRYEFPVQPNLDEFIITKELTTFKLSGNPTTWWIPAYGDEVDSEFLFQHNSLSDIHEKVHTPLTMEWGDTLFTSIHEAALIDFPAMTLMPDGQSLKADLVPWADGSKAIVKTPFRTPWRTMQLVDNPGELITSYLVLNLNEPNKIGETDWIKPGKYNGIWWSMHLGKHSWAQGPDHGASTKNVKEYIDFAAENDLSGVLVEGWNEGWDHDWSEGKFNFTKPYVDFDIETITKYAQSKGVGLIGHHETGGNIKNYEVQLPEAFEYYQKYGVHAVKTGYVTRNPNGNEWHQGQMMVRHYQRVTELAAKHQLMLDIHEPVKATGLRRTYPNLMTREGARGTEYEAWSEGNPPEHTVTLPFTRCLAGPLDYTPGIFEILLESRPENRVHTTIAKQLALYVTIYSPLQMAADLPENYCGNPAFQFIRDVPTDWEETLVLNAKIGDYLTIVRKDRNSDDWYLGSTTDEESRQFTVSLDFLLPDRTYKAQIYSDSDSTDLDSNPTEISIHTQKVTAADYLTIKLAKGGGQAIRFELLD